MARYKLRDKVYSRESEISFTSYINRGEKEILFARVMNGYIGNEKIRGILCKSGKVSFIKLGYQNPIDETRLSGVFAN